MVRGGVAAAGCVLVPHGQRAAAGAHGLGAAPRQGGRVAPQPGCTHPQQRSSGTAATACLGAGGAATRGQAAARAGKLSTRLYTCAVATGCSMQAGRSGMAVRVQPPATGVVCWDRGRCLTLGLHPCAHAQKNLCFGTAAVKGACGFAHRVRLPFCLQHLPPVHIHLGLRLAQETAPLPSLPIPPVQNHHGLINSSFCQTTAMEPAAAAPTEALPQLPPVQQRPLAEPVAELCPQQQMPLEQLQKRQPVDTKRPAEIDAVGAQEQAKRPKLEQQQPEAGEGSEELRNSNDSAGDSVSEDAGSEDDEQGGRQQWHAAV